ncbi:hypothetical protein N7465_006545 [Penicillium sp. CMV-2018d]|nr:hypothetical protein N7465_006545 [Penicillium sp. CMV-2018d]
MTVGVPVVALRRRWDTAGGMLARVLRNGSYSEKAYLESVPPRLEIPFEAVYIRFNLAKLSLPGMPGVLSKEEESPGCIDITG